MASIQPRGERFQLRVKHALLHKPFFWTFDTESEARAYGEQLEAMLARGIVPVDLAMPSGGGSKDLTLLTRLIKDYEAAAPVAPTDLELLGTISREMGGVRVHDIVYRWVEDYVRDLKIKRNLAPGSIRKRVGTLARVLDWHHRQTTGRDQVNPFRLLPVGYSSYTPAESAKVEPKFDVKRDRRLTVAEDASIRLALSGVKAEGKERALKSDPAFILLYDVLTDAGLRLSEAFKLPVSALQVQSGVLRLSGSRGHRGAEKPRVVPLKPALREKLTKWCEGRVGLMFPFWDGTPEGVKACSKRLTVRFGTLFDYAEVKDLTAHDLRHEAACRWFELKTGEGRWTLSDVEVCRLMGWSNLSMALRYASLRGEDLVARLRA